MPKEWRWPVSALHTTTSVSGMCVISLLSTTFLLTTLSPCTLLVPGGLAARKSAPITEWNAAVLLWPSAPWNPPMAVPSQKCPPPVWPSQDWAPRLTAPSLLHLGEYVIYSKCSVPLAALISTINLPPDVNELSVVCFDLNYLILGWIKIKAET